MLWRWWLMDRIAEKFTGIGQDSHRLQQWCGDRHQQKSNANDDANGH